MTTIPQQRGGNLYPNIPLPAGADFGDIWQGDGQDAHRVIMGANRGITDSDVVVWTSAIQFWDGDLDRDGAIEAPKVHIEGDTDGLNSDQTRELAAVLLESAAELDRWTS